MRNKNIKDIKIDSISPFLMEGIIKMLHYLDIGFYYITWKKYGFCPTNLNLSKREDILKRFLKV
ncbi:hypothetical protein COU60_05275 [Candidatus Pacearchaeota archaeon CG10_big_fil_rev_8_21_14_0_10_34_76]|nr:MAG: hypothetical protein COU60_05275 [Candidatus Pacearchaeota archaeon CG10_big_fil_rev_8_21_14_0_10_34_76]